MSIDQLAELASLPDRTSKHFAMFLVMDARGKTAKEFGTIPNGLLKDGLVYLCAWGPDSERVHDIFDEVAISLESQFGHAFNLMSTWHSSESLDDALWFFLNSTVPDEVYANSCGSALVVSVGNQQWSDHLFGSLSDIPAFNARVLNKGDKPF